MSSVSPYFLMDYIKLASSIHDLTRSLTNWSSTVCIPTSESGKFLDISCTAKGNSSSAPLGATNQPTKYPVGEQNGSFYRFDPALYHGQESWTDLKRSMNSRGIICTSLDIIHSSTNRRVPVMKMVWIVEVLFVLVPIEVLLLLEQIVSRTPKSVHINTYHQIKILLNFRPLPNNAIR